MRISLTTAIVGVISLIGVAIVYSAVAITPAKAQVTCQTYGNMTTCYGNGRSTTCQRYGNMVTCN
jgi:hypothetical protein